MRGAKKRLRKDEPLTVIIADTGDDEWTARVRGKVRDLGGSVVSSVDRIKPGTHNAWYVGCYLHESFGDDAVLDDALERGMQFATEGFLDRLCQDGTVTMERASLPEDVELDLTWPRLEREPGFERPFPQTFDEFTTMLEHRVFGRDGNEILLVDLCSRRDQSALLDRCLVWFRAFFFPAKVSIAAKPMRQKARKSPVDDLTLFGAIGQVDFAETNGSDWHYGSGHCR